MINYYYETVSPLETKALGISSTILSINDFPLIIFVVATTMLYLLPFRLASHLKAEISINVTPPTK